MRLKQDLHLGQSYTGHFWIQIILKKIQKVFNLKCKLHESLLQSYQILVEKNYTTKQSAIYIAAGL